MTPEKLAANRRNQQRSHAPTMPAARARIRGAHLHRESYSSVADFLAGQGGIRARLKRMVK